MAELSIRVGKYILDLPEDAESNFYITKQIHDLANLQTRNASFSKRLKLPRTLNNIEALKMLVPSVARDTLLGYNFINCDVRLSGYPLINAQITVITEDRGKNTISVQLFDRTINFYDRLSEESIKNLNWRSETFNWNVSNVLLQMNATENILFGRSVWFKNENWRSALENGLSPSIQINDTDINYTGCWYYVKSLMEKIFSTLEIDVDLGDLADNDVYDKMVIAIPSSKLLENFKATVDISGVLDKDDKKYYNVPYNVLTSFSFDTIKENVPFGIASVNNFTVPQSGYYDLSATFDVTLKGIGLFEDQGFGNFEFRILVNGQPTKKQVVQKIGKTTINFNETIFLNASDTIAFGYENKFLVEGQANPINTFRIEGEASFSGAGSVNSRLVPFVEYLPDISQKDFVKEIFKIFNLVAIPTDEGVTFKYWNKVEDREYQDLTAYNDANRGQTIQGFINGYGQINSCEYTEDELLERTDGRVEFPSKNEILPAKKTVIKSKFGSSDTALSDNQSSISVPLFNLEYINSVDTTITVTVGTNDFTVNGGLQLEVGDEIFVKNNLGTGLQGRRIVTDVNGADGKVDGTWSSTSTFPFEAFRFTVNSGLGIRFGVVTGEDTNSTLRDGGTAIGGLTQKIVNFTDELTWDNLLNENYSTLINMMEKPTVIKEWFRLPPLIFSQLDNLRPVYFKNKLYYLNKIEQWSAYKFCRLELIELK